MIDMTGLRGRFDFTLNMQRRREAFRSRVMEEPRSTEADARLAFMQERMSGELGLRVEPRRAPVELLVVGRARPSPVEN